MPSGHNPIALGQIVPNGTITRITDNLANSYGNADASQDQWAHSVEIQMIPGSVGPYGYLGYIDMNTGTFVNVLHVFVPGETYIFSVPPPGRTLLHLGDLCVVGTDAADAFLVNAWES